MATAIAGARSDNATALAIMWQGSSDGESTGAHEDSMISTRMLEENQVNTTISAEEAAEGPHEVDAFSEDEIEKAIAEIRDAIEKSSQILKP
jgi:protein phosphatase